MFLCRVMLFLCLLVYGIIGHAQSNLHFTHYTEQDGLSDNHITCFLKDKSGLMWIGTEKGLNRFDGKRYKIYSPRNNHQYLSNPHITDIEQDTEGRIWVSTQNGLNVIDPLSGSTIVYSSASVDKTDVTAVLPSDFIWDTYIDAQDRVWIASDYRDLCLLDIRSHTVQTFPWMDFALQYVSLPAGSYITIQKIAPKNDTELWIGTNVGLFSFNCKEKKFTGYNGSQPGDFVSLQPGNDGEVFFVQKKREHFAGTVKLGEQVIHRIPVKDSESPRHFEEHTGTKTSYWLPYNNCLLEIRPGEGVVNKIAHIVDDAKSFPQGEVTAVYQNEQGIVWAGTHNGIAVFSPGDRFFSLLPVQHLNKLPSIVQHDYINTQKPIHSVIYSPQDNNYYISSPAGNCLIIKNAITGKENVISSIEGIPLLRCSVIFEDGKGFLWILANRQAFRYNRNTRQFTRTGFMAGPSTITFTAMTEDTAGNFWIAAFNDALYHYSPADNTTRKIENDLNYAFPHTSSLAFQMNGGYLWIGTFSTGLYRFDTDSKKIHAYDTVFENAGYKNVSLVTDVKTDKYNGVWIATYNQGIFFINRHSGNLLNVSFKEGLPGNAVYALLPGIDNKLWAVTFSGISWIDKATGRVERFEGMERFFSNGLTNTLYPSLNGSFISSSSNKIIRFTPKENLNSAGFPVILTSVTTKRDSTLNITNPFPVQRLAYDNNDLEFQFAALSYLHPSQTGYAYQLEGYDPGWIAHGNNTAVKYTNLAPGHYTFRVKAEDYTGKASDNIAAFSFYIAPSWWQSWWFLLSAVIIVLAVSGYIYKKKIKAVKNKAALQIQMSELKEQVLRSRMNPHFIFNSLNAIQELIITENYKAGYQYLSTFSKLMRKVLNASEKNLVPLQDELDLCRLYLELESLRFRHSFTYNIIVDAELETENILFPPLLLQPFIENAIWHGLLHKQGIKKITLRVQENGKGLVCSVTDNGVGREKAVQIKRNKIGVKQNDSRGILLAQQRLDALRASALIDGSLEMIDCRNEAGNAAGTRVNITIVSPETQHE